MALVLGADVGTSTISALAVDAESGALIVRRTAATPDATTPVAVRSSGFAEWDAPAIADRLAQCLHAVAEELGERCREVAALCLTGQQHGVVLVDDHSDPVTPYINWQDRRGEERLPGEARTCVEIARELVGSEASTRTGCRLATGYLAITLFWLKARGRLPSGARACFITDFVNAHLTGAQTVTDSTMAASSGVFDVQGNRWDEPSLTALGLPRQLFPEVRPAASIFGHLTADAAAKTGLPAGLPVLVGLGDNQASFLGSVTDRDQTVLVNVGTGGQVSVYTGNYLHHQHLEMRPFPGSGYLLVSAGLCGGRSYALLEQFFRRAAIDLYELQQLPPLYSTMNQLAASVSAGANGLRCEPFFTGTRAEPSRGGALYGLTPENFKPAHLARALLEGMAEAFRSSYELIHHETKQRRTKLVCAGNGLRENPLLVDMVARAFQMPAQLPQHPEEAAYGAARLAAASVIR